MAGGLCGAERRHTMNRSAEAEWVRRQAEIMREKADKAQNDKERDFYRCEADNYAAWLARLEKDLKTP